MNRLILDTLDERNLQEKLKEVRLPIVLAFSADWCKPCLMLEPILEEVSGEYKDVYSFFKIDVDDSRALSERYGILSVPTLILFKEGMPSERIVGFQTKKQLMEILEENLKRM